MVETRTLARADVYKWGAVTAIGVIAGYLAVVLANARHFYTDDTESQYAPLWVMLGRSLREGHLPVLVPENWMAGNYAIEEAGLLNPPQLLIDLIAPSFDNLALYATIVKLIFAIILALGVYRICLEYGSKPRGCRRRRLDSVHRFRAVLRLGQLDDCLHRHCLDGSGVGVGNPLRPR